jgi:hypothetical protein
MADGYYWNPGCLFDLLPQKKPEGMNQDYWDARKKVSIDIDKYFKWINGKWSCTMTMSGYYRQKTCADEPKCCPFTSDCGECTGCGCCPRPEQTTSAGTAFEFMQQGAGYQSRENKCPQSDFTGPVPRYLEGSCPDFNSYPSFFGRRPDEDLKKTFYNVCLVNQATGWFTTTYKRRDMGPQSAYCDDPAPGVEWIQAGSTNADSRTQSASTCTSSCCPEGECNCPGPGAQSPLCPTKPIRCYYGSCRVRFFSNASIAIDRSWYDPETKKVYPNVLLESTYPSAGWLGQHPKDGNKEGPYGKHSTTTNITVDGVKIPAGTSWGRMMYMGTLSLTINWSVEDREK